MKLFKYIRILFKNLFSGFGDVVLAILFAVIGAAILSVVVFSIGYLLLDVIKITKLADDKDWLINRFAFGWEFIIVLAALGYFVAGVVKFCKFIHYKFVETNKEFKKVVNK